MAANFSDVKVCLINAPYLDVYGGINIGKNSSFPLGLGYIASVLKSCNFDVKLLDPEAEGKDYEELKNEIVAYSPDVVGMTSATANFTGASKIAQMIKVYNKKIVTVIGGIHASALRGKLFEYYPDIFDVICYGEGEYTMLEIAEAIREQKNFTDIKGVIYKNNDRTVTNPPRDLIHELDSIPFPARDLVDLNDYRVQPQFYRGYKSATMITSRGCPFGCTFCASELTLGSRFRMHSAEYVLREIEMLIEEYGVKHIVFVDDCFTVNKKRLRSICQAIIQRKYEITWHCFARVDTVDEEILQLMKQAGCFSLLFGIESGDEHVLEAVHKGISLSQAEKTLKIANRLGFKTVCGFIIGLPGETEETIHKTIQFAKKLNPTIASFNFLIPFPGTPIYEQYYKKTLEGKINWELYNPKPKDPLCSIPGISQEQLQKLISQAYIQFYARPGQWLRILGHVKNTREFFSLFRGFVGISSKVGEWITTQSKRSQ